MRLTNDVIVNASVSINPLRERELNLRGYKAPAIENLGVTKDTFDCIDLSDNEIKTLENFPRLKRLRMLIIHTNHISKIQEKLEESIENLQVLLLTNNKIAHFSEIEQLSGVRKLDTLSLLGNPVIKRKFYREFVIYKLPQLRVLDYKKIRPAEREAAEMFFNSINGVKYLESLNGEIGSVQLPSAPITSQAKSTNDIIEIKSDVNTTKSLEKEQNVKTENDIEMKDNNSDANPETNAKAEINAKPETNTKSETDEEPESKQTQINTTPKKAVNDSENDENMAENEQNITYTPSKPIESMTVTILRKELKRLKLPTSGLKAELVQRLKSAVGE